MRLFKKLILLASCTAILMAGSTVANANTYENKVLPILKGAYTQAVLDVLSTTGEIIEVTEDGIVVKGEQGLIYAMITDKTYLLNGKNGKDRKIKSFKVGKEVTVYHSPKMTRSIPAQAEAFAVVLGAADEKQGKFFVVDKVKLSDDGNYISVIDTNHSLIATIDKEANKDFAEIQAGDNLVIWYNMMTMSLPAKTNAQKVVILPEQK